MSLQACANLVHQADPSRWRAAMSAPISSRAILLPIYAANIEISRAPWVTAEPWIAEMRLQWWRDVLDEIQTGSARRHEVVDALANVLTKEGADYLKAAIDARRWDIAKEPFQDADDILEYAKHTTLGAMGAAFAALGGEGDVNAVAQALGLSRFLQAVFDLKAHVAQIFPSDWTDADTAALVRKSLHDLERSGPNRNGPAQAALVESAGTRRFLKFVSRHPESVLDGTIPGFAFQTAISRAKKSLRIKPFSDGS